MCTSYSTCVPERNWIIIVCLHKRQSARHNERAARHKLSRWSGLVSSGLNPLTMPTFYQFYLLCAIPVMYVSLYIRILYLEIPPRVPLYQSILSRWLWGSPSLYLWTYYSSSCPVFSFHFSRSLISRRWEDPIQKYFTPDYNISPIQNRISCT